LGLTPLVEVSGPSPFLDCPIAANDPDFGKSTEVEPYVAVDPTNPDHLVGAWIQDFARGIVAAVSFNGGDTWQSVVIPGVTQCAGGIYPHASDPWVSFAPNGDVYVCLIGFDFPPAGNPNALLVSKSTDGGLTWGAPTTIVTGDKAFQEKAAITADPTNPQFAYLAWSLFDNKKGGTGMFSRTTDGGQTWEPARVIFDPGTHNFSEVPQIVVLPDGTLVNFFVLQTSTNAAGGVRHFDFEIALLRSSDHGRTWLNTPIPMADVLPVNDTATIPGARGVTNPDGGLGVIAPHWFFDAAVDPANGNLYAVWQDVRFSGGQYASIAFSMSTDGGFTWSSPIRVNQTPDDIPIGNRQAFLPSVAVNQDGVVAVTYYDFRHNTPAAGLPTDHWMVHAHPSDGLTNPASWSSENRLTTESFNIEDATTNPGAHFIGDYQGLVARGRDFGAFFAMPHGEDLSSIFYRDTLSADSGAGQQDDGTVPSVTLLDDFPGLNFHVDRPVPPPDTHLAAGPHHLVEVVNNDIAFFNKESGDAVYTAFLTDFFAPLGPFSPSFSTVDAFDPQVSYDELAERFIVTALSRVDSVQTSHLLFAISDDADPRGNWEMHKINVEDGDNYWGDFDRVGWDADGIYVSMLMKNWVNSNITHSSLITIDKSSVLDSDNSTLTYFDVRRNADHLGMQPAVMHGAGPGDPMLFVRASYQGGNSLVVTQMTDKLSPNPTFTDFQIKVARYDDSPDATQPSGDSLATSPLRAKIMSTAWRDDHLVAALHAGDGDLMRASWYEFNTDGPAPTLVQSGRIDPGAGIHRYFPSIEIAPNGDLGMTYMQSSATEFPSMYITGRTLTDAPGVMQTPVLVKAGEESLRSPDFFDPPPIRVGDYSGIAIDPRDGTFWAANEYAKVVPELLPFVPWGTWIANFSIEGGALLSASSNSSVLAYGLGFKPEVGAAMPETRIPDTGGDLTVFLADARIFLFTDDAEPTSVVGILGRSRQKK
jgi:hypothetical protein